MKVIIRKQVSFLCLLLLLGLFSTQKVNAASLSNVSDTVTTSRPSAAAPLFADQTAGNNFFQAIDVSGSTSALWLASDSAVLLNDTGQALSTATVASMSAQQATSPTSRFVYLTSTVATAHHKGTTVITPITATHTIKFTTSSSIPASGHILIVFPVPASNANIASPSATGFSFNGMTASNPTDVKFNNATCTSVTVTASTGTIDCLLTSGVSGGTAITVLVGCTAGTTSCTTSAPRLINPTKTAASGTADTWKVTISTTDTTANGATTLDSAKAVAGTVEAVQVQGTVDAFLTFTIAGKANGVSTCGDTTNSGIDATATFVNLGSLSTNISIAAQKLTVTTNGAGGYAITATSSGRFINPASGFYIADANVGNGLTANDTPAPGFLTAGTPAFGIHPCAVSGSYTPTVSSGTWGSGATGGGAGAKYSNPWNTGTNGFYASISNYSAPAGSDTSSTDVEYASTVSQTTPAGIYSNYFTYVATPVF